MGHYSKKIIPEIRKTGYYYVGYIFNSCFFANSLIVFNI